MNKEQLIKKKLYNIFQEEILEVYIGEVWVTIEFKNGYVLGVSGYETQIYSRGKSNRELGLTNKKVMEAMDLVRKFI